MDYLNIANAVHIF